MKTLFLISISVFFSMVVSAQEKITSRTSGKSQKQHTHQNSTGTKSSATGKKGKRHHPSAPVNNNIAVSDPGMPEEVKNSSSNKRTTAGEVSHSTEKKKDDKSTAISPK